MAGVTNLTTKFAPLIDEVFVPAQITDAGTNQNYKWDGAKTIDVTGIVTQDLADYDRGTGFGNFTSIDNTSQVLTLRKDRYFNISLDRMDEDESVLNAGNIMSAQLKEKVQPEVEAYRLAEIIDGTTAGNKITAAAKLDKTNAYEEFLRVNEKLDDALAPATGRVAYVTPAFYNLIKQSADFIKASDMGQAMLKAGVLGEVDGVQIIKTPKPWLKKGTKQYECVIVHNSVTVAPIKLQMLRVITDSELLDGTLMQGRIYYDAFVLDHKKKGIALLEDKTA